MRAYELQPSLRNILRKLLKKDKLLYERVMKKVQEVVGAYDVEHYKNLRHGMSDRKGVHVGSFVLTFKYVKSEDKIIFVDFDHHDNVYC